MPPRPTARKPPPPAPLTPPPLPCLPHPQKALAGTNLDDLGLTHEALYRVTPAGAAGGPPRGGSPALAPAAPPASSASKSFISLSEDEIEELVGAPW